MKFARCSILAALLAFSATANAADWAVESYNPVPLDGDLVLPMPCGGAMAFRKVSVPGDGLLDDQRLVLGSTSPDRGYAEYQYQTWLAGSFSNSAGADKARHYYVGKYEVTAMQVRALTESCPSPTDAELEKPAVRITWAEAALFAERYTDWLLREHLDRMPAQDGAPGFLRLPTEAEWEFAARGGARVSPSAFADTLPFPARALDQHVIHDGNSYRELNLIGSLAANPLGLHDMLGNAAELVLDPFRLNAVTHLHGRAGGFVLRGGSYRTRPGDIRSSFREEFPPVDEHGLRRQDSAGFRLVLVAPALPSRGSIETAQRDWKRLPREAEQATGAALPEEQANPVDEVLALAEAAPTAAMRKRLENLSAVIAASIRTRNQQRDRAARELLSNAVFAARRITLDMQVIDRWDSLAKATSNRDRRQRYEQNRDEDRAVMQFNLAYYLDRLVRIVQDYDRGTLGHQADLLSVQYEQRDLKTLPPLLKASIRHLDQIRNDGTDARDTIEASLWSQARAAAERE